MAKVHKITSYFFGKRKFLRPKNWSQGTSLGSLGPLSFKALGPGFDQGQILFIWGPCEPPVLVALHGQAKSPKTAGAGSG